LLKRTGSLPFILCLTKMLTPQAGPSQRNRTRWGDFLPLIHKILRISHLPSPNIPARGSAEGASDTAKVGYGLDRLPPMQAQRHGMVPRTARSVRGSNGNVDAPIL
jgi:hypothetical protein